MPPKPPCYWSEPDRFPFLVRVAAKLAGFVLMKGNHAEENQRRWDMAEFFVLRSLRRAALGTK